MGIELLLNDYYALLKLLHENEVVVLDETIIPLTQQQIADALDFSKMKVNSMFNVLQREGLIEQKTRGKYVLSDRAENIIKSINKIN
ncbi:MAG: helix-turn-helix domain-containing protein [Lachnospiraceae bacterium]|nr:helix-turn-helix domain-containing protein [Lachnospiraceae bacterium]